MAILILTYGLVCLICFGVGLLCGSVAEKIKAARRNVRKYLPYKSPISMKPTETTIQYLLGGKFRAKSN